MYRGCHGRDRMVVGFTTTYSINAKNRRDRARINPTNDVSSNPAHVLDTTLCDKVCP